MLYHCRYEMGVETSELMVTIRDYRVSQRVLNENSRSIPISRFQRPKIFIPFLHPSSPSLNSAWMRSSYM